MADLRSQLVELFLKRVRSVATDLDSIYFVPRPENRKCIVDLNLTIEDIAKVLRGLSAADYAKGPEADENGSPGEVWVFKPRLKRSDVYVKFKLYDDGGREKMTIISFHR